MILIYSLPVFKVPAPSIKVRPHKIRLLELNFVMFGFSNKENLERNTQGVIQPGIGWNFGPEWLSLGWQCQEEEREYKHWQHLTQGDHGGNNMIADQPGFRCEEN